ncbi:hypothetical protein G6F56_006962 [Rhizopus delemar]|nr:hypothetical protein G6F56_006962 [Rhizopus delemar]
MELDAIDLWKCFIETLDYDGVKSHLLIILQGLINICCHSSTSVRHAIAETIMTILSDHEEDLDQLPDFPTLPELDTVRQFIADKVNMTPEVQMKRAYDRLFDPDETSVLIGVKKLSTLLTNDVVDSERYLTQLFYVSQKYAYQSNVMYYIAICLGKLGAVDPNRVNVDIKDETIYVLEDFKSTAENQQFICRIIMDCILPAFNAAEEKELPFVYYSIQTLLHDAGFTTVETMKQKKYQSTLQLWLKFPPSTQELLAPFLRSSYKSSQVQSTIEYPIYPQSVDVDTWVRLWYSALEKWATGAAKKIFSACLPVVLHGNTKVTTYLLPHLVHHIILSAPATETQHVIEEILSVLEIETEKRALEVVVSITQHCRQSLYKNPTRLGKMSRFLESIPDKLMAKASFRAKAYPQALMHLETYIKTHPEAISDTIDILPLLSQTYGHLDMKADLDILVDMYSGNMFSTAELICAESLGQWDLAIIHYKDHIKRKPDDIDACLKYLKCLKKAGNLVSVFFEADCFIKRHPEWLSQLNTCKMDAAWRIGNYELLEELAKIPSTETHDTFVAQILHFMKQSKSFNMAYYLERARRELASQLGAGSYYKLYPTLFNLQILQEIEDSLTQKPQAPALDVKMISPQFNYTHELLQVRKAILYDMKSTPGSANIWLDIAKQSRKNGNMIMSLDSILNAERESGEYYYRERAKLEWAKGMRTKATRLLLEKGKAMVPEDYMLINSFYLKDQTIFDKSRAERYMLMGLQCTKKAEKAFNQITRFHLIHVEDLNPILARYGLKSLSLGTKYYYSTMSNIINSWFKVVHLVESLNENENLTQARQILDEINKRIKIAVQVMPVYMSDYLQHTQDKTYGYY